MFLVFSNLFVEQPEGVRVIDAPVGIGTMKECWVRVPLTMTLSFFMRGFMIPIFPGKRMFLRENLGGWPTLGSFSNLKFINDCIKSLQLSLIR